MSKKKLPHYNLVTIGSAVKDIMFYTAAAEIVRNPKQDPTKVKLIGFEFGAKIHSDNVYSMFGGGAANTAVIASTLGLRVATVMRVGRDSSGDDMYHNLKQAGVATRYMQRDQSHASGFSFLVVDSTTDEHVAFVNYGANEHLQVTPKILSQFTTDWFYVPALSTKRWPQAMQTIIKTSHKIAWNPGAIQLEQPNQLKKFLPKIQVLILNTDEAIELSVATGLPTKSLAIRKLAEHIFNLGVKLIVITDGRAGAYAYDGTTLYFDKPNKKQPKDTTGAGDAFGATFITGLIRRPNDIQFALRLATLNASAQVAQVGAQTGVLTWKQIMQRI